MRANSKTLLSAGASLLLLVAIGVVFRWLWSGVFLTEIHSDTVDTLFWAAASHDAGSIANPTFQYGYFIPFGGNLLMQPFIPLFGVGMTTLRIGMSLFILIFAFSAWYLFRALGWSRAAACAGTALICAVCAATPKMREIYYGHVLYYSLGSLSFILGCALVPSDGITCRQSTLKKIAFGICMAWAASCGKPLLLYTIVPIFAGWIIVRFLDASPISLKQDVRPLLPGIIGTLIGIVLFSWLSKDVLYADDYDKFYSSFAPANSWWGSIEGLFFNWLSLFEEMPNRQTVIVGSRGIRHVIRITVAFLIAFSPLFALLRIKFFSRAEKIVVFAHLILTLEILFFWIFGNISDANWRLCPVVITATITTAVFFQNLFSQGSLPIKRFSSVGVLALGFFLGVIFFETTKLPCLWGTWRNQGTLIPVLKSIGIRDGYCTSYWLSNVITTVSNSQFRIREVEPTEQNTWAPRLHNSDSRWYEPNEEKKQTIFICSSREAESAPVNGLIATHKCYQRLKIPFRGYDLVVFVYDGDCLNPKPTSESDK